MATAVATPPKISAMDMIKRVSTIATLPEVTARIIQTVEDPKSSATQLHKIVSHDPALVTRILKVVNSAFYGLPGQIGSIDRAIVLLGLNAVKNIAVAASLGQLFRGAKLANGYSAKDLWTHCIAVAVTARDLAKQHKLPIGDEAFLAGMIHDIGILISLQTSPEALREVCERAAEFGSVATPTSATDESSFCSLERQIVGVDHQQLGMALSEHWKFPRPCQVVAGFHHQPLTAPVEHRQLAGLIWAADTICCHTKHGFNLTAIRQTLDANTLGVLGLDAKLVDIGAARIEELLSDSQSFLA